MQLYTLQLCQALYPGYLRVESKTSLALNCAQALSLELLFKGAKDLVILTMGNIVWFHIHVTGKCLLIHLHLLACPDVGICVFHSIFPLLLSRGCIEELG